MLLKKPFFISLSGIFLVFSAITLQSVFAFLQSNATKPALISCYEINAPFSLTLDQLNKELQHVDGLYFFYDPKTGYLTDAIKETLLVQLKDQVCFIENPDSIELSNSSYPLLKTLMLQPQYYIPQNAVFLVRDHFNVLNFSRIEKEAKKVVKDTENIYSYHKGSESFKLMSCGLLSSSEFVNVAAFKEIKEKKRHLFFLTEPYPSNF